MKPQIRWDSTGQFDVIADGAVVYSAQQAGRLPTADEIMELVKQA